MNLSNTDYEKIVKHYGYKVPQTKRNKTHLTKTKKLARDILVKKLCQCIKKVQKTSKLKESGAIAICNNTIFTKRNIKHFKFSCKKRRLLNKKGKKYYLQKTRKRIGFSKK